MPDEFDIRGGLAAGDFDADPDDITPTPPSTTPGPRRDKNTEHHIDIQELSDIEPSVGSIHVSEQRERVRGKFALYYVLGFLIIVVLALVAGVFLLMMDKLRFEDLTNILVTISGILSGPLGFIIGYYFKAESND